VSNSISHVDESLLRRFDFILPFPELTNKQREEILRNLLRKHQGNYLNEDDITNLSSTSKINTGHFSRAMEVVAKMDVDESSKRFHFLI